MTYADAIYLATRGSALLLDMTDTLGSLKPGYLADFLLVDMAGKRIVIIELLNKIAFFIY